MQEDMRERTFCANGVYMQRVRIGLIFSVLPIVLLLAVPLAKAAPRFATALVEGRTYDQAHDSGYIDWSGPAQYVYITHRDGTFLPPEEGGGSCGSSCSEWVTRLGNGGIASGSFNRDVSYFEVMVGFIQDGGVGNAILRACSSVNTWYLYGPGTLPGFVSMSIPVPAGCRNWSLAASSGFVDFRSIDVNYIGPPPTSTFTPSPSPTFTPTMTPTRTPSPTPTFTPTLTPTHTPSPTPTPLPPVITGVIQCTLWGDEGWCRGEEALELSASDPQGFDVTITGDLNGIPFTCRSSCDLPLLEGTGTVNYTATSASGRTASGSSTWKRDGASPELEAVLPPVDGKNGWYVSEVQLSANATDAISGLANLQVSTDDGNNWTSLPIQFTDGRHHVLINARDVAGNETIVPQEILVDTIPPIAQIVSHSNGNVVSGDVNLSGTLNDATSGPASGEVSMDEGATWQEVTIDGNTWSTIWHSGEVPNGEYTIQVRGIDRAGKEGEPVSIVLTVDNGPPTVSITEKWWIWESGKLRVTPNHFPITSIRVMIHDPGKRWPAVELELNSKKTSFPINWDRRFGDGTLAPSGDYPVLAVACDLNGLCAQDEGQILIPETATSTPTQTPLPTATPSPTPSATPVATKTMPAPTLVPVTPIPDKKPEPIHVSVPFWQLIGLLGLFLAIASASVVDPRPKALGRLKETFRIISSQSTYFEHKKEN
jgi:hypothetical protein